MTQGIKNRENIENIKSLLKRGQINMEQAKELAMPIIDDMNLKGKEIAKEFGKKYNPITFQYLMR